MANENFVDYVKLLPLRKGGGARTCTAIGRRPKAVRTVEMADGVAM